MPQNYTYFGTEEDMGVRPEIKPPLLVKDFLSKDVFDSSVDELNNYTLDELTYDRGFGRFMLKDVKDKMPNKLLEHCMPKAKEIFNSETLVPTYACYVRYKGARANLVQHRDSNACTYTLDLCLTANADWPLVVEDVEYILKPNEALCFYGEDQLHWRVPFPDKENTVIDMIFLHYVEPSHWFHTKGPSYYPTLMANANQRGVM
jgi:hypothetical protein